MKKLNKLVALLLAAVMVLGMMPAATAHAHEHHTHAIEDHPVIALDTPTTVTIENGGDIAYFAFTPEVTDLYHFYSSDPNGEYNDTYGSLYDAEMNLLGYCDDAYWGNPVGVGSPNFLISYVLEAGTTYLFAARLYSSSRTGTFAVTLTQGHEYTGEITKEMTCSEDGERTYTCTHCGASYTEVIPAEHVYNEETGECVFCGEQYLLTGACGDSLTWELDFFGNLTIKGTGAMYDYLISWGADKNPSPWYDYCYDIASITIEDGCSYIGNYAFYQCGEVTEVVVPDSVTSLGSNAFGSCYNLASVTLPDALTTIPESCFSSCGSLTEINWPASLTTIAKNAFYGCSIGDQILPEGVTTIGQYAFSGCSNITKLTLPTTLTTVEDYAFASMWSTLDFIFTGDAPTFGGNSFYWAYTNAWYPADNATWTEDVRQSYGGTVNWIAKCAEHDFGAWETIPATCTVGEYMTRSCNVCGWVENGPEGEPLGHDLIETVIEPNCATYEWGRTEITCTRCDYYESKDWVAYEHNYVEEVVEATCAEGGYTLYTCTVCSLYYSDNYTDALGHSVESWSEPSEATCTEDGVKTGLCSTCNETVSEVITPALGHEWDMENPTENADGTMTYDCIRCDETYTTEGPFLYAGDNQFTIEANTGSRSKTYTATEAGKLTITLNNVYYFHHYSQAWNTLAIDWAFSYPHLKAYVNGTESAYTVEGSETAANIILAEIEVAKDDVVTLKIEHTADSFYNTNELKLNVNVVLTATHTHEYEAVVTEPTCTEGGYTTYTCSCGDSYVADETDALGHSWKGTACENCDATRENPFTDVPEDSFYIDPVLWAVENGITNGATETTFNPTGDLQRAQVVVMLWRAAGKPEPTTTVNPFTDVTENDFFYKAVLWAVENEITNGATETTFNPYGITNRAQAVTFLWRYLGKPEATATNSFTDVEAGQWYEAPINWAVGAGVTNGISATEFGITSNCNRAQIVTFLYRALA